MTNTDPYPTEGYQPIEVDPYPTEGYEPVQADAYPTEGYQSQPTDPYPTQGYTQPELTQSSYGRSGYSQQITTATSYEPVKQSDWAAIRSMQESEKLVSNDPSYKLRQETYLADRRYDLEEQVERIQAKESIQAKLEANRSEHGRTEPTQSREKGEIER